MDSRHRQPERPSLRDDRPRLVHIGRTPTPGVRDQSTSSVRNISNPPTPAYIRHILAIAAHLHPYKHESFTAARDSLARACAGPASPRAARGLVGDLSPTRMQRSTHRLIPPFVRLAPRTPLKTTAHNPHAPRPGVWLPRIHSPRPRITLLRTPQGPKARFGARSRLIAALAACRLGPPMATAHRINSEAPCMASVHRLSCGGRSEPSAHHRP